MTKCCTLRVFSLTPGVVSLAHECVAFPALQTHCRLVSLQTTRSGPGTRPPAAPWGPAQPAERWQASKPGEDSSSTVHVVLASTSCWPALASSAANGYVSVTAFHKTKASTVAVCTVQLWAPAPSGGRCRWQTEGGTRSGRRVRRGRTADGSVGASSPGVGHVDGLALLQDFLFLSDTWSPPWCGQLINQPGRGSGCRPAGVSHPWWKRIPEVSPPIAAPWTQQQLKSELLVKSLKLKPNGTEIPNCGVCPTRWGFSFFFF